MAAEPSTPTTSASGNRWRRIAVTLPAPQPRSTTRAGASSGTWASRSSAGRRRSPANRKYCAGSQTAAARATSVPHLVDAVEVLLHLPERVDHGYREQQKAKRVHRSLLGAGREKQAEDGDQTGQQENEPLLY